MKPTSWGMRACCILMHILLLNIVSQATLPTCTNRTLFLLKHILGRGSRSGRPLIALSYKVRLVPLKRSGNSSFAALGRPLATWLFPCVIHSQRCDHLVIVRVLWGFKPGLGRRSDCIWFISCVMGGGSQRRLLGVSRFHMDSSGGASIILNWLRSLNSMINHQLGSSRDLSPEIWCERIVVCNHILCVQIGNTN